VKNVILKISSLSDREPVQPFLFKSISIKKEGYLRWLELETFNQQKYPILEKLRLSPYIWYSTSDESALIIIDLIGRMPRLRFLSFETREAAEIFERFCNELHGYSISNFGDLIEIERVEGGK
jgi:hypothetical protein